MLTMHGTRRARHDSSPPAPPPPPVPVCAHPARVRPGPSVADSRGREQAHKDSPADQLAKLAALNSEGIIDNDQYRKAKAKVMAELHKQREAEAGAAPGQKARGRGSEGPAPARDEGEREREEEERRKEAREGSGHKSEEQQEREERARESAAGTVHPSEEQREASLVDTAKAAKKVQRTLPSALASFAAHPAPPSPIAPRAIPCALTVCFCARRSLPLPLRQGAQTRRPRRARSTRIRHRCTS